MGVTTRIERVTPAKAAEWLACNETNRPISRIWVARYAADLKAGKWQLNGQTIVLSGKSTLLDGQHRLTAIVETGVTVLMIVVRGVEADAFKTIDSGKSRTFANVLAIDGFKNCSDLAATLKMVGCYSRGSQMLDKGQFTKPQLAEILIGSPEIVESVDLAVRLRSPIIPASTVAFCHHAFRQKDEAAATEFVTALCTGDKVPAASAIGLLRARLIEGASGSKRLDRRITFFLLFRAWNAVRSGERLKKLQIPTRAFTANGVSVDLPELK